MSYFPVPDDAFASALPKTVGDYLVMALNWLWTRVSRATTGELHVYANSVTGDDGNDGLSPSSAKKTLQAVFSLIPPTGVNHWAVVHLDGDFSDSANLYLDGGTAGVIIDGGTGTTVVADDTGSDWTADISSTSSIGLSTAGWTPDQYAGYWVEITSGVAEGQTRLIQTHDGTTITPIRNFSADPGSATFRIVRPTTTISGTADVRFRTTGPSLSVQHLYLKDTAQFYTTRTNTVYFRGILDNVTSGYSMVGFLGQVGAGGLLWDTSGTPAIRGANTDPYVGGWSQVGGAKWSCNDMGDMNLAGVYLKNKLTVWRGGRMYFWQGCRFAGGLEFYDVHALSTTGQIVNTSGYAKTTFNGVGFKLVASSAGVGSGVEFNDSSGHGIEALNSHLLLDGAVAGSSNTGAGVYAHMCSAVVIEDGAAPTITGTVGDLSFDGTTQASTWAAIDGGTPATSTAEMTVAKEV